MLIVTPDDGHLEKQRTVGDAPVVMAIKLPIAMLTVPM